MEKQIENLSFDKTLLNHSIEKSCGNCFVTVTKCPSEQAPCWCCHDHSEWKSVPESPIKSLPSYVKADWSDFDCISDFFVAKIVGSIACELIPVHKDDFCDGK